MRQSKDPYSMGKVVAYNEEPEKSPAKGFIRIKVGDDREAGFRVGEIGSPVKEGEEPGGIADMNDEEVRNAAVEEFASKIKNAVSAKLMGKKLNLKLNGNQNLVSQIVSMIDGEVKYLNALMNGESADTPALQKNKALLDAEAKKLDRMLGVDDFRPFK
jgi:hypothetical protein